MQPTNSKGEGLIGKICLKAGRFTGEPPLTVDAKSATVFVGPNHSGKTQILKEIKSYFPSARNWESLRVLGSLEFKPLRQALLESLRFEITRHTTESTNQGGKVHTTVTSGGHSRGMSKQEFESELQNLKTFEELRDLWHPLGQNLANHLCLLLNGNQRLQLLDPTPREDLRGKMLQTLGILFQNDEKRKELQRIIHLALGLHLAIDVTGKDKFRVAISDTSPPSNAERSLDSDALNFFGKCADISEMSDGVRAFAGMLAAVIATEAQVILIDEPEAFLHPALCRNLAHELCRKTESSGRQLIVSTHSSSFLYGCVQSEVPLNIVRLTYHNKVATARVLEHSRLVSLMRNPLLRSMGLLNGIFFEAVVVAEADRDRAFYEEINKRCLDFGHPGGIPDCLFLNAQNWQTTKIIGPLRELGIPAAAVIDLDIVCEEAGTAFQFLLEAAGVPSPTRSSLGQLRGNVRPPKDKYGDLKRRGTSALSGEQQQGLKDFIEQLAAYGLFVVPCGEVENWLPELTRQSERKNEWLESTFTAMGEDRNETGYIRPARGDVWEFMVTIRSWLQDPNRKGM
jgi:energy-coupling factor transporter ATP-binding protein EcfA2